MALNKQTATTWIHWHNPQARRGLALLIVLLALFAMGLYAVTEPERIAHSAVLTGGDWMGAAICHRITERSFTIFGRALPLCARCTGMYLGVALTFGVLLLAGRWRRADLPSLPLLLVILGFIGIMGVDGLNSYSHFFPGFPHVYEPRNWLRLVTGMGTGLAMALLIFPALAQTLWRQPEPRRILGSWRELAGLLLLAATAVALVLSNQSTLLYVLALVSVAGVLAIVTAINAVLLLIVIRRDGVAERWQETAVPLLISLALAVTELLAMALIRYNLTGTITSFPGLS